MGRKLYIGLGGLGMRVDMIIVTLLMVHFMNI